MPSLHETAETIGPDRKTLALAAAEAAGARAYNIARSAQGYSEQGAGDAAIKVYRATLAAHGFPCPPRA